MTGSVHFEYERRYRRHRRDVAAFLESLDTNGRHLKYVSELGEMVRGIAEAFALTRNVYS